MSLRDYALERNRILVAAPHADQSQVAERLGSITDLVDVVLFTGPLQRDLAQARAPFVLPSTFVPLDSAMLFGGLLRGVLRSGFEVDRVSIDSLSPEAVRESLHGVGVECRPDLVRPYDGPASVQGFADFHEALFRSGQTSGALTSIVAVAEQLAARRVPVERMVASVSTLKAAVDTAGLLGAGMVLQQGQIATVIVAGPSGDDLSDEYARDELRLELHTSVLPLARELEAVVVPGKNGWLHLVSTFGSLARLTGNFTSPPRIETASTSRVAEVLMGIGLGDTAHQAHRNAERALEHGEVGKPPLLVAADGSLQQFGTSSPPSQTSGARNRQAHRDTMDRLSHHLASGTDREGQLVGAEEVALALGITTRSARRKLHELVAAGLAWQVPQRTGGHVGRPRVVYRLSRD